MKRVTIALMSLVLFVAAAVPAGACPAHRRSARNHYAHSSGYARTASYNRYNAPRSAYYNYNNGYRGRTFWQKHRDKLTTAIGAGGGAIVGGLIGGKRGAGIGALAGGGGSALYTYKLRNRNRRY